MSKITNLLLNTDYNYLSNTDTSNAELFIQYCENEIKYCNQTKSWYFWTGYKWEIDKDGVIKQKLDLMLKEIKASLLNDNITMEEYGQRLKILNKLSNTTGKNNCLKEAQHVNGVLININEFDQNPYLINCKNGIIDIANNKILPHDKKYNMLSYIDIDFDLNNDCVLWNNFLNDVFENNSELIHYIQKAVGYSLTGDNSEQVFFQLVGDGSNGKSLFQTILSKILGDYGINSSIELFTLQRFSSINKETSLARLVNKRYISLNETEKNARLDENLIKQFTGGDVLTARELYKESFDYTPIGKLWISSNYKLNIRGTDYGIWRRVRVIPFNVKYITDDDYNGFYNKGNAKQADKKLLQKILTELPQILGWAIRGAIMWKKEGLLQPYIMKEEVTEYKQEMDTLGLFLQEWCEIDEDSRSSLADMYDGYTLWTKQSNEWCMSKKQFSSELEKRFKKIKSSVMLFCGIRLKEDVMVKLNQTSIYKKGYYLDKTYDD